jgi:hypothetical protein
VLRYRSPVVSPTLTFSVSSPPLLPSQPNARPMNGSAPRRNSNDDGRKKREIRPPAPPQNTWDPALGGASSRRKSAGGRKKGDEQMKYIKKALDDLFSKKAYYEFSYPFQNPVGASFSFAPSLALDPACCRTC